VLTLDREGKKNLGSKGFARRPTQLLGPGGPCGSDFHDGANTTRDPIGKRRDADESFPRGGRKSKRNGETNVPRTQRSKNQTQKKTWKLQHGKKRRRN